MKKIYSFSIAIVFFFTSNLFGQDGSLDLTFDMDGKVANTTFQNYLYSFGLSSVIQNDEKIITAGYVSNLFANSAFALARYNPNGSLDTTFDADGKVITFPIAGESAQAQSMALQSDGKIVVTGYTTTTANPIGEGIYTFATIRYNTDGSLDTTFGNGGIVTTPTTFQALSVAIQNDGKIVVGGTGGGLRGSAVVRYNTNGSIDTTFGINGIANSTFTNYNSSNIRGNSILIQNDGKIILTGTAYNSNSDIFLVRYNNNGTLDDTFGTSGKLIFDISGNNDSVFKSILQNDGKIIIAGSTTNNGNQDLLLVRFQNNGSLDSTFNTNGIIIKNLNGNSENLQDIKIQNDNKIVVCGFSNFNINNDGILLRYNSNGILDNTFAVAGIVAIDYANDNDEGNSLIIQNDGKIVVSGNFSINGVINFGLARFNNPSLGLPDIIENPINISIFPNPTSEKITIQSNNQLLENASVTLTNLVGQIILKKENINTSSINIDINAQSKGIYFLTIENKGEKSTQKIIKE
jgi:uncharacterized delta-60 repeat protein